MTPREYIEQVIRPNLADIEAEFGSVRKAFNAVHAVDALAAHIFYAAGGPDRFGCRDDTRYRAELAKRCPDFALVRDLAKAIKHVKLIQGRPTVSTVGRVQAKALGWGEARWGEGRYGGPPQAVVTTDDGRKRVIETVIKNALAFLEQEMAKLGL